MQQSYGKIKLTFTRHGETEQNIKKMIGGQSHGTLTQEGIQQAKKIGVFLKDHHYDHIYVSDLGRAIDTFTNIKEQTQYFYTIQTQYLPLLRQKSAGVFEGQPRSAKKEQKNQLNINPRDYKPENGENSNDVLARCQQFLELLVCKHILHQKIEQKSLFPKNILAISHSIVITQFYHLVKKISQKINPESKRLYQISNCSLHDFEIEYPLGQNNYHQEKVKIKSTNINFIDHLK